ncbi:MAG: ammonium transporter [Gemmatimonas sp.]
MTYKSLLPRIGAVAIALAGFAAAAMAQDATPAAAVAEAKVDTGDTAWMLTSTALVLMMTIPGLALFYGGMVRKMNVLATMMQSFAITCLVTILWAVVGYSLAFTDGNAWVGDLSRVMLANIGFDKPFSLGTGEAAVATTIPESVFMMFQMTFAIITPALICGSFADRMKFSAMMWFMGLWSILIYAPIAHWVWQPNGFLFSLGVLDFAGGTVVHINAGIAGLVAALVLGKRQGYGKLSMAPHNLTLTLIGASLLWVGWFGFNAGSAVGAGGRAGMAMTVTQIATAAAALGWLLTEWLVKGKPSVLGIASGAVAGLVAITPASGYVLPGGAIAIGIAAGVICFFASTTVKNALGYDDSLDAFGVHCVGGIVGAILTGVFSVGMLSATDALPEGSPGLLEGNPGQVITQLIGIACTLVYSGIGSLIILKIVDAVIGLRVTEEEEREGLDQALHGEAVH